MNKTRLIRLMFIMFVVGFFLISPSKGSAKWWDKFGEPQYGGALVFSTTSLESVFDPVSVQPSAAHHYCYEHLFMHDWTLDRNIWSFKTGFVPVEYFVGHLVEKWEWQDGQTMIAHIRKGVHFQNKPPVNGREFSAYDLEHHYDRVFGTGSGYTKPSPVLSMWGAPLAKVTATDKYTAVFKFKKPTPLFNMLTVTDISGLNIIACEEVVKAGSNDWKNSCGTGAYMLTDFVPETSVTLTKNPDYWGYDDRYPKNRLPYVDEIKIIRIQNQSTAIAALRSGRIDWLNEIPWQQAGSIKKTNPELVQIERPNASAVINFRCDAKPFTDIRVRKAMQLAIDRKTIAKSFYGGLVDGIPAGLITPEHKGWNYAYNEWPKQLKDEYSYNPRKARQLLADAGYPKGFTTNIIVPNNADMELMQIIKALFKDIGVEMEISEMDIPTFMSYIGDRKQDQMTYSNWSAKTDPPQIRLSDLASRARFNSTLNNDPEYDAMFENLKNARDTKEAKELVRKADKYALQQHWGAIVCPTVNFIVWQPHLKGYSGEDIGWSWIREWIYPRIWVDRKIKK